MSLSREAARALETGRWDGIVTRALAAALSPFAARGLVRPAQVPSDVALVCVGGSTLGGSGKTRVAIACARELARISSAPVALVGHAYGASRLCAARIVSAGDSIEEVGDEALVCARELASVNVPVVVAPNRQAAIDHALALESRPAVLVLDGPLRVRGHAPANGRSLAVLAVDAHRPWGSGRLPPAGDLRAPRADLMAEADHVISVDATPTEVLWQDGRRTPLATLRSLRLGLFTAIARPDRLVHALDRFGIRPHAIVSAPDHGPISPSLRAVMARAEVDAWVGTRKCVLHLERQALPVLSLGVLDSEVSLPATLALALDALLGQVRPRSGQMKTAQVRSAPT